MAVQVKFDVLGDKDYDSIAELNDNLGTMITESAGVGRELRNDPGKLSKQKGTEKRRNMKGI